MISPRQKSRNRPKETPDIATILTRRRALALSSGALAAAALGGRAFGAERCELNVFGHRVHQAAATDRAGRRRHGGLAQAVAAPTSSWVTLGDVNAIHERLLREATPVVRPRSTSPISSTGAPCPRTCACSSRSTPSRRRRRSRTSPISPRASSRRCSVDGALHGIPVRHATNVIVYNEALFEERGVAAAEDLRGGDRGGAQAHLQARRRHAGLRPRLHAGLRLELPDHLALPRRRLHDGRPQDRRGGARHGEGALRSLADLYKAGVLPRNIATLNNEEITTWMQQGRGGHEHPALRAPRLLQRSRRSRSYPGKIKPLDAADGGRPRRQGRLCADRRILVAGDPGATRKNKKVAWDLIARALIEGGNHCDGAQRQRRRRASRPTPIRSSAKRRRSRPTRQRRSRRSRIHLPAFDEQARAHDIFVEETPGGGARHEGAASRPWPTPRRRVQPLIGS